MEDMREHFLELERRYWDAMKERDGAAAAALSGDPTIVVGAQGAGELPRQALEGMIAQAGWSLLAYEVEGRPLTLVAYDASVWVKADDGWVCPLHTESPAGDPFGRDRM